jgi:hypothetical protein
MCGADSRVGGVDAIYMGLVYALYAHAIFLDQTKCSFEGLFFGVHILEFILCFCTLDALYLYHLVRLECHEQSQQREDREKRSGKSRTSSNKAWLRFSSSLSSSFFSRAIFSDLCFSSKSCVRSSSSSSLAGRGGTSEGNDADVKWPDAGCDMRCGRDAGGGEFGGCVGVDRPLPALHQSNYIYGGHGRFRRVSILARAHDNKREGC